MGKGGSAPAQPTTQTVQQSNIPEYARPYFEDIMTRGQTVSQAEYQPYTGQRVAEFNPMQQQAFQGIQNLGVSPLIGAGAGMTGVAGIGGLGAQGQYTQQATSPGAMQAYMSPYMQNVVDWQKSQAIQDYGRQLPGMQAAATRQGAFGGSRQAIVESEAQRNLQNQLAGIQATGTQSAFDAANKNLQFGSQLGLQGLGLAGQMGQQFGQLGQTAFGQQAASAQAQQQAGAIQQAQEQQKMDLGYEEFMRQQLYPQSQLQFLSSLLRGSVVAPQQTMYSYQQQPSMASQIGGLGIGALGLSQAFKAEGGEVKQYAVGGVTGSEGAGLASNVSRLVKFLMASPNPRQEAMRLQGTPLEKAIALQKVEQLRGSAQNQQALAQNAQNAPQQDVLSEMGLGGQDAGVMENPVFAAAGGGIVAFQEGGIPRGQRPFDVTDPFGILSGLKDLYGRPRKYATPAEEARARRLEELAQGRVVDQPPEQAGIVASLASQTQPPVDTGGIAGRPATRPEDFARPATTQTPPPPRPELGPARAAETGSAKTQRPELVDVVGDLKKQRDSGDTSEQAEEKMRARLREVMPDFEGDLNDLKEQAKAAGEAKKKDMWLALAMGGFAAAAGSSPYALKNFGEGLGLTSKQLMEVNKDFRKAEQERQKVERETKNLQRAQIRADEGAVIAAGQRVEDRQDKYNTAIAAAQSNLNKIFSDIYGTESRERVGMAQVRATKEGTAAYREAAQQSRNITAFNTAVQKEKDTLMKSNPAGAISNPQFEAQMEQQAMRNVIARNPQFAEIAGVPAGATQPAQRATMRYNPQTGKVEPVQ
jgi:hypothetical protein